MAIDSAAKRRAVSGTGCVALIPGVTPSAGKGAAWRKQSAWTYAADAGGASGRRFSTSGRGAGGFDAPGRQSGTFTVRGDDGTGGAT